MSHNLHRREGEGKKTLTKQISLRMNKRLGEGRGQLKAAACHE